MPVAFLHARLKRHRRTQSDTPASVIPDGLKTGVYLLQVLPLEPRRVIMYLAHPEFCPHT
jgi:hypothetical protein